MDLKLVLSLNLIILLVAYGTEARKMVQDTSQFPPFFYKQGAEGNHQQALKDTSQFPPFFYKQGAEGNHQQALKDTSQFPPFFYKQGDEGNHQQALKDTSHLQLFLYKQGAEGNHQQALKDTSQFPPFFYKQGAEGNHQQALKDTSHLQLFFYKQGAEGNHQQALKDTSQFPPFFYKQGDEGNHQQALKDTSHLQLFFYKQGDGDNVKNEKEHIHSASQIDPSLGVFFLMDDLKLGKAISVFFPRTDLSFLQFFPKEAADSVPFTLKELPNLLQRFSLSKNSPLEKSMEDALRICEESPIKGETKYCATSAEAMLDFVQGIMGEKTQIEALSTTTHFSEDSTPLLRPQNYTILDAPQDVVAPKMVACHPMPCAYTVYYCHYTISKSKVFKVSLRNEANGDRVEAVAVCHLDTSEWSPSHVSFRVLGILPGTSPVCHFFPSDNLVWVPKAVANGHEML